MTIPNRVTLEQFAKLATREAERLPLDQLAALYEDAAEQQRTLKAASDKLHTVMSGRFAAQAADARRTEGKDTGVVHIVDGDYDVAVDVPKSVAWDQPLLAALAITIRKGWGEDPANYLTVKLVVDERRYTAWPPLLQAHFTPARTVKPGKATFEITPRVERRDAA